MMFDPIGDEIVRVLRDEPRLMGSTLLTLNVTERLLKHLPELVAARIAQMDRVGQIRGDKDSQGNYGYCYIGNS